MRVLTTGVLQLRWTTDGSTVNATQSSVATGITDGATKWVRATMDVNDGAGNRVIKFYTSDDGTTWTQLGTTASGPGTTSIFDSTAVIEVGSDIVGTTSLVVGTIYRTIIQSAYDTADNTTSLVFDADFDAQAPETTSFNEAMGARVTIVGTNPTVTINTTRYSYGMPNMTFTATGTVSLLANLDYYLPFIVNRGLVTDMIGFEVTTGPASSSTLYYAIYAADDNLQPTGTPLVNDSQTVSTSATGVFRKQITPLTLQPGTYLLVLNPSVAFTVRRTTGGPTYLLSTMGNTALEIRYTATRTAATFPSTLPAFTGRSSGTTPFDYFAHLRWKPA